MFVPPPHVTVMMLSAIVYSVCIPEMFWSAWLINAAILFVADGIIGMRTSNR